MTEDKQRALRYNTGKLKWSLVHYKSLEPMVRALEFGANKYSPDNWKKGLDEKEILESIQRHVAALLDGEQLDPESGVSHMGHIQCNAMFYNYFNLKENIVNETREGFEEERKGNSQYSKVLVQKDGVLQ